MMLPSRSFAALLAVAGLLISSGSSAQGPVFEETNPDISGSAVSVSVSFDSGSGLYTYVYTVSNPNVGPNTGAISSLAVDISAAGPQPISTLARDIDVDHYTQDGSTIPVVPVGVETANDWSADAGARGDIIWGIRFIGCCPFRTSLPILPGGTFSGLTLRSPAPPGMRQAELVPIWDSTDPTTSISNMTQIEQRRLVPGPVAAAERTLYDGGGQKPVDVNLFLRFASPLSRATQQSQPGPFPLVVVWGSTTIASTFHAELDGADVTSLFTAVPGGTGVASFNLTSGRHVFLLSIDGQTASGRVATDTDRLVVQVP